MHFSTALVVLSGASVALAGSFAAPAAPALALRQASREQIVGRQRHNMQKVKRQNPSIRVNACGAPTTGFVLQLRGINSNSNGDTVDGELNALNNQYVLVDTAEQSLTAIQSLGEATTLALNDANCNFESPDGTRFANLDSVDTATLQTLYFSTDAEAASADENFGTVSAPVACSISSGTFTCNGQTAADAPLNAFVICNNADTGAKFLGLATQDQQSAIAGCTPVTIASMAA